MERSLKITSDGRLFEMEDDQTIQVIKTEGRINQMQSRYLSMTINLLR